MVVVVTVVEVVVGSAVVDVDTVDGEASTVVVADAASGSSDLDCCHRNHAPTATTPITAAIAIPSRIGRLPDTVAGTGAGSVSGGGAAGGGAGGGTGGGAGGPPGEGASTGIPSPSWAAMGDSTGFPHAVQNAASSRIDSPHWLQNATFLRPGRQASYIGRSVPYDGAARGARTDLPVRAPRPLRQFDRSSPNAPAIGYPSRTPNSNVSSAGPALLS